MAALCFTQQNVSIEVRRRTWTSGEVVGSTLMLVGLLGWPSHYLTLPVRRGSGFWTTRSYAAKSQRRQ